MTEGEGVEEGVDRAEAGAATIKRTIETILLLVDKLVLLLRTACPQPTEKSSGPWVGSVLLKLI